MKVNITQRYLIINRPSSGSLLTYITINNGSVIRAASKKTKIESQAARAALKKLKKTIGKQMSKAIWQAGKEEIFYHRDNNCLARLSLV